MASSKKKKNIVKLAILFLVVIFGFIIVNYNSLYSSPDFQLPIYQQDFSNHRVLGFVNPNLTSLGGLRTTYEYICASDVEKTSLVGIDFKDQEPDKLRTLFHQFVGNPHGGRCPNLQRFGGVYREGCQYWDGQKYLCISELIDDIDKNECLIYSFGVAGDWSFEKAMGSFGCKVLTFDPSVDYQKELEVNVSFEKLGLSATPDEQYSLDTLSSILKKHGHTKTRITYLKIDIEGYEVDALLQMFESGALDHVQQIGLEYHLPDTNKALKFFHALTMLYFKGDFRLISFDMNGCVGKSPNDYTKLAEIVLMRTSKNSVCIEKVAPKQ